MKLGLCEDSATVDYGKYRRLIGKLIYLNHTRPDIAFTVNLLSDFMQATHKLLAYLKGTMGHGLLFQLGGKSIVEVYTDSNYGGSIMDSRSTIGYCMYLGGNLIT